MSSRGKKMLGMVQSKANLPRTPLRNLSNLSSSSRPKFDLAHMKNFLDSIRTPAEIRLSNQITDGESEQNVESISLVDVNAGDANKDANNLEGIEFDEEALDMETSRIDFGNLGFISLGENADDVESVDNNDNGLEQIEKDKNITLFCSGFVKYICLLMETLILDMFSS